MRSLAPAAVLALLLAGCADTSTGPGTTTGPGYTAPPPQFRLSSPAFANGGSIPARHTCDGASLSPPLGLTTIPAGTVSVALTMKDPDVPTPLAPVRTITHWVAWNATPSNGAVTFPEGGLPPGARQGANDFGSGYLGPCPPPGSPPHRYNLTAYALDVRPSLPANATAAQLEAAMGGHVLAKVTLTGLYERKLA